MMDMIVAVLILCFIVGVISSALFVASFYLYRESRRLSAPTAKAAAPAASAISGDAVGQPTMATACDRHQRDIEDRCCSRSPTAAAAVKRRGDCASCRSGSLSGRSGSDAASCSYTCEVCGSCCAGDLRRSDERWPSEGSRHSQQQPPPYPCGEFLISGVDIGFKCHAGGGGDPRGTFFFYRGRQPGELLEPVCPSDQYLTMAALPSVPYHLWFCPARHEKGSRRCPDCRQVFNFELCDSEILFHHRRRRGGAKRQLSYAWLLVCEEVAGRNSVIYRGDAGSVSSLHFTGKLFVYFGLPDETAGTRRAACSGAMEKLEKLAGVTIDDKAALDKDDHSPKGDSKTQPESRLQRQPERPASDDHRQRRRRGNGDDKKSANGTGDGNGAGGSDPDNDAKTNDSLKSEGTESLLSMSSMRKAVKWPITQIENLIESSSSDERPTDAADGCRPPPPPPDRTALESALQATAAAKGGASICEGDRFSIQLDSCQDAK